MFSPDCHSLALICLSILSSSLCADDTRSEWAAGPTVQQFQYQEFNASGASLNEETGILPGAQFAIRYADERLSHQVKLSLSGGDVDYDGQTQGGAPHLTDTRTRLYGLGYRIETANSPDHLTAYMSADWTYWSREIQPAGFIIGLDESYRWPSLGLGLKWPLFESNKHALHISGGYLRILPGRFTVDLSELGYSKQEINLGSGEGGEASLLYRFGFSAKQSVEVELFAQRWSFQASAPETIRNGARSLTFLEPRSKSQRIGLAARLVMPF